MSRKPPLSNTFFLVSVALMAALGIVLTRVLRVDLGFARFSLGQMASIMAGLWLGPVGGALSGGIADVAGSFLQGYARGMAAMKPGADEAASAIGIRPEASVRGRFEMFSEVGFHAPYREWARLIQAGVAGKKAYP